MLDYEATLVSIASVALLALASCSPVEAGQTSEGVSRPAQQSAAHVDSVLPAGEALRRFRADLSEEPAALGGDFTSREALVRRFVDVLERSDTLALEPLVITRAEFAYLYYPSSPLAAPPYELAPSLMWFQLQENNRKAASALLRTRGGTRLGYAGHECYTSERQGANTVWSSCHVLRRTPDGSERRERLFGTIVERDGRYKFVGLSNELQ